MWRKAAGVEPTWERLTPPTGFEVRTSILKNQQLDHGIFPQIVQFHLENIGYR